LSFWYVNTLIGVQLQDMREAMLLDVIDVKPSKTSQSNLTQGQH